MQRQSIASVYRERDRQEIDSLSVFLLKPFRGKGYSLDLRTSGASEWNSKQRICIFWIPDNHISAITGREQRINLLTADYREVLIFRKNSQLKYGLLKG